MNDKSVVKIIVTALHTPLDLREYVSYICYVGQERQNRTGQFVRSVRSNSHGLGRNFVYGEMSSQQYAKWKKWLHDNKKSNDALVTISEQTLHGEDENNGSYH